MYRNLHLCYVFLCFCSRTNDCSKKPQVHILSGRISGDVPERITVGWPLEPLSLLSLLSPLCLSAPVFSLISLHREAQLVFTSGKQREREKTVLCDHYFWGNPLHLCRSLTQTWTADSDRHLLHWGFKLTCRNSDPDQRRTRTRNQNRSVVRTQSHYY